MLTYVDHDSLLAHLLECKGSADSAPIELDGRTNSVDSTSKNESSVVIEGDIVGGGVVRSVQVVGISRELGGKGINLLHEWLDTEVLTASADLILSAADGIGDLSVGESHLLGLHEEILLEAEEASNVLHLVSAVDNVLELVQEPLVNLGQVVETVDSVALVEHSLADSQPTAVSWVLELVVEIVKLVSLETDEAGVNLANGLLDGLLEGSANSHDLSDRLHGGTNVTLHVLELGQIPTGDLGDDVIQRRLEVGAGGLCNRVGKLGERVAETNLGSSVCERVTGSLGSKSRRTRETGVDLDDSVVESVWLQSVLDVTLTNNTEMANNLDSGGTEHVVLLVAQGLGRRNDNGVTSVNAKGIEVLHVADGDAVVGGVADNLILDFLPSLQGLLDQDLRGQSERPSRHVAELLLIMRESRSKTTQSVGSADDDGVSNNLGGFQCLLDGSDSNRLGDGDVNLPESLSEELSVLTGLEGLDWRSQDLDSVLLEKSHAFHLDTQVQGGLATESEEDSVRLLALDNIFDIFGGNRQIVDLVGEHMGSLNRGNVRVDEDRGDTSFFQSLQCLRTCEGETSQLCSVVVISGREFLESQSIIRIIPRILKF